MVVIHTGVSQLVQGDSGAELHIYTDAADAIARGVSPGAAHAFFDQLPGAKGCVTKDNVPADGSVDCSNDTCIGRCHVFSIDNNDPPVGPPRDEGPGPVGKEPGRIYRCSCVKTGT